jgi:hypothetical protein
MTKEERDNARKVKALHEIAAKYGGTVRSDYSGRFMFGALCYGIECTKYEMPDVISAARRRKVGAERTDNMGLDMIVYWPSVEGVPEPYVEELEEEEA